MNTFELYKYWDELACKEGSTKTYESFKHFYNGNVEVQTDIDQFIAATRREPLRIRLFDIACTPKEGRV